MHYSCGYSDLIDCIDQEGFVDVPDGVGLGVQYDWDFIKANTTNVSVFE